MTFLNSLAIRIHESKDSASCIRALVRHRLDPFQEERHPCLPIAVETHSLEQLVVSLSIDFEMQAEVEQGLYQGTLRAKEQGDQEATDSPVAVQEWMVSNWACARAAFNSTGVRSGSS